MAPLTTFAPLQRACSWDAGEHLLICYAFKDAPDREALPPLPEPDSEWEDWDEEDAGTESDEDEDEERKAARERERNTWRPRQQPGWW